MATNQTLEQMKLNTFPGDGILRVLPVSLYDFHLEADGSVLTTTISTNPGFDKAGTNMTILAWAADKVVEAGLQIQVPDDYDNSKDHLKLRLKAKSAGSTDAPGIDAKAYLDSATTTDLDPTISADLSATLAWVEIDLSGNGLAAGDVLQLAVFPEAHSTDAVEVYAAKLEYRSTLVFADPASPR